MGQKHKSCELLEPRVLFSTTYDAANNFSLTTNPNGPWSYGVRSTETANFAPFAAESTLDFGAGAAGWSENSGSPPYVGTNVTGSVYSNDGINLPTGVLVMHPGINGEFSDVQFTVPTSGTLDYTYRFRSIDPSAVSISEDILHNGQQISGGSFSPNGSEGSSNQITVAAGDTLDFLVGVGKNQTYNDDATSLSLQITTGASANHLVFSQQPQSTVAGVRVPLQMKVEDAKNHVVTNEPNGVTLTLHDSNNANVLDVAQVFVAFKRGVATFTTANGPLILDPGTYSLFAEHADANGIVTVQQSNLFTVERPHFVFIKQPTTTGIGEPIAFALELENSKNKPVDPKGSGGEFHLLVTTSGGAIQSDVLVTLQKSKFDNSKPAKGVTSISAPQTPANYVLTAIQVDPSTGSQTSSSATILSTMFTVMADHLAFKRQPSNAKVNAPVPFQVVLQDWKNKQVRPLDADDVLYFNTHSALGQGTFADRQVYNFDTGVFNNATVSGAGQTPLEINGADTFTLTVELRLPDTSIDPRYLSTDSKSFRIK